jgi:PIN domain nuclease of toxin-antitoxin system
LDILLDTHVFLWWDAGAKELSRSAAWMIANPDNKVFVSAASIWEIAIKRRLGKLSHSGPAVKSISDNGFFELPVLPVDAELAGDLEWAHHDPFDRMLVAQANRLNASLMTADKVIQAFHQVVVARAS